MNQGPRVPDNPSLASDASGKRAGTSEVAHAAPRLMKDALINYSGLAVGSVVGILLIPFMLRHLGASSYGLWLAALTLATTLRTIDFGLGPVVVREVSAAAGTRRHRRTAPLVSAAGGMHILLGVIGAILLVGAARLLAEPLRLPDDIQSMIIPVFTLVGVAFVAEQWIAFISCVLMGLRHFGTVNAIAILLVLLRAGGTVLLLLLDQSLKAVAIWHVVATLIVAMATLFSLWNSQGGYRVGWPGRHWASLRRHLSFGLASFASVSVAGLTWQALPLLAAALLGAGAVTTVHVAQKIPIVLIGLYGRVAAVVFPAASEYQRRNDVESSLAILETGSRIVLHLMLPASIIGLLAAPELFKQWINDANQELVLVFQVTLLAVLADAYGAVATNILWGRGRVRPVLIIAIFSTITVTLGMAIILPRFGIAGAALILAIMCGITSLLFWTLACRSLGVPSLAFLRSTSRGIGMASLGCAGAVLIVSTTPGLNGIPELTLMALLGVAAYLVILVKFGATAHERQFLLKTAELTGNVILSWARKAGRLFPWLRSLGYLILSLKAIFRHPSSKMTEEFERTFRESDDPWQYGNATQRIRIQAAMDEMDRLLANYPDGKFENALEIGCAEGVVTESLAPRCRRLVAVDLSSVALARSRKRCANCHNLEFHQSDVKGAAAWGPYDLVVAMDLLECIRSPRALRHACQSIEDMLHAQGYLVVTTTRQHPVPEGAWWGRWLPIGARINEYVSRHKGLKMLHSSTTRTHAIAVYQKVT
jgi:O-antigen/teichoic acid export membrane protein/SAM-dependent methyltransferase